MLLNRSQLWAIAVRDSFVALLPLTIFGTAAVLLGNLPIPGWSEWLTRLLGTGWQAATQGVVQGTYGIFGLALAMVLSSQLARRMPVPQGEEPLLPLLAGISAMANFMLVLVVSEGPDIAALGHASMLLGIAVGIATPELLRALAARRSMRWMALGYESAPLFYHATRLTPAMVVAGLAAMLVAEAVVALPAPGTQWLSGLAPAINRWMDADWLLTSAAVLINQGLWFAGIHGGKVLDQLGPQVFGAPGAAFDPALAWRPLIDNFVLLGGTGATLGLMVALFIVAREGPHRRVAQMSVLPSIFNINELLIFGLPIALNPMFLLPFLLAPLALAWLSLAAVHAGLVPLHNVAVPWTTPPLLSGYLITGSWRGVALQAAGLLLSTLIYLPFARRVEAQRLRSQADALQSASEAIVAQGQRHVSSLRRNDEVGLIARGLFADLARDIGSPALALAFQPKHDRSGAAVGVEALLRWTHPRHGPIRADVAVTLAEDGDLIRRLGAWVLDEACARKAQWNALGLSRIRMAINVSPLQLLDPQLPAQLAFCLAQHRLSPGEIELEITESHAVPAGQGVDDNLGQIVAMGVTLAMDDFGMGYSSLLHLRRFPVHAIKIDGSLTRDVLHNPICGDIIATITAFGRAQQVEVVAEFVETAEQQEALAALGCDVFQGYLHSAPLPSAACVDYLLAHAPRVDDTVEVPVSGLT
ncbi:EAL domain-containing protein [Ideonella sp. A 288]|uniref:EAL domain-containing protein n=1 Tax=Ideonella sp. A 288 TaxID=1962181 RepID=UPI000B4AF592|nr:EAL domain-containing protein [Ideonella sp. A 288]